jgi:hypothetical protein
VLDGEQFGVAHAKPTDEADVVCPGLHIGRGNDFEPALFAGNRLGGKARLVEAEGRETFEVRALYLDFCARARGKPQWLKAVEARSGEFGASRQNQR